MSDRITLRSGARLQRTIAEYDAGRPAIRWRRLRAVCYAPFLSMDFDATGAVRLCNHSHSEVAHVSDDTSILDVWRGAGYQRYRDEMRAYVLDEHNCHHCIRQCATAQPEVASGPVARWLARWRRKRNHVFATEQFDASANDDPRPAYPHRLIFRLNNTCNLACVMCDGLTSSRIRRKRDGKPPQPSMYGERFFKDMEEILPHVKHVEFYGGEPFLVKEHIRIFEILERINARCTIYVNTNAVSFHPRAKRFLETLNFRTVAVSMDAVSPELHAEVRQGLRSDLFHRNIDYLLGLRARRWLPWRKPLVMLNVTEHRKNWFELPEVFRFAQRKRLYLHINTCIHPHNLTLYTLPSAQCRYVLDFLEARRAALLAEYPRLANLPSYDFLLSLLRGELDSRTEGWQPAATNLNTSCDGLLAAPRPGLAPFDEPESVAKEARRIVAMLDGSTAARMLHEMVVRMRALSDAARWRVTLKSAEQLLSGLGSARHGVRDTQPS